MPTTADVLDRPAPGRPPGDGWGRRLVRGLGELLVTAGVVVLLFVVYELWVTDLLNAREQGGLRSSLGEQWGGSAVGADPVVPTPEIGEAFALIHIPRLGADYVRAVVEGEGPEQLAEGPGHYAGSPMPGRPGNVGIAGHRTTRGAPFKRLDELRPGDPIVLETADSWYVYRVLGDPATGDFDADPSGVPGREVVSPADVAVLDATPDGRTGNRVTGSYLTLTTCHPEYSARQRLVVHAALDGDPVGKAATPEGPAALHGR